MGNRAKLTQVFVACLIAVLSVSANAGEDPSGRTSGYWFTSGNPYYNAGYRGECTWYAWGRCAETGWSPNCTGNAKDYWTRVTNGGAKNNDPEIGAIMVLDANPASSVGHVAYVVQVNDWNSWVVEEYNMISHHSWSRETITRSSSNTHSVKGDLFGWTPLLGFVHSPFSDTSAPSISWGGSPTGRWYNDSGVQVATWSLSDSPSGVKGFGQAWDSDPSFQFNSSTGWLSLSGVGEGQHTVHVHAWDNSNNNSDNTRGWYGWDVTAPSVTITSGPSVSAWYASTQRVYWHVSDGLSGVRGFGQAWDSTPPFQYGSADGWLDLQEGSHTLHVHAYDNTDNGRGDGGNERDYTFGPYMLDTAAPTLSLTGPSTSTWLNTPQSVTWSATDATSGIATQTLTWDNGLHTDQIPEGKRSATITATDNAGNSASQSFGTWWVDTVPPLPTIEITPSAPNGDNGWYTTNPTISVVAIDPNGADGSGVDQRFYTVDGAEATYVLPVAISGDGIHTCSARATDVAGNSGSTADLIVKVDTTPPVFSAITTDSLSMSLSILAASFDCADPDSGIADYEYWIGSTQGGDDIATASLTNGNNWAYATNLNLAAGATYYITVRAKNNAGLWSSPVTSQPIIVGPDCDASPSFNAGGVSALPEARVSANYLLLDSLGQFVVDSSCSANYSIEHGYWHSDVIAASAATIGAAKLVADTHTLQIGDAAHPLVVTLATDGSPDRFYVEQLNRASGIAVQYDWSGGLALSEGDLIWLIGGMNTVEGERIVQFAQPRVVGHRDPLAPLFISAQNIASCGTDMLRASGLSNTGLLVRSCGKVTQIGDGYLYIDDGNGFKDGTSTGDVANVGVRVLCGPTGYISGEYVIVTGISSCFATPSGRIAREIITRSGGDVRAFL